MLKKTISYVDYDGNSRTEDFYFNLTRAELVEMELSENGGLSAVIRALSQKQDIPELAKLLKRIILASYGEKGLDGKHFVKSKEMAEAFTQTNAYSELYISLVTSETAVSEFVNGLVDDELAQKMKEIKDKQGNNYNVIPADFGK